MTPEVSVLVITPVHHIEGVVPVLEGIGRVSYLEDASQADVQRAVRDHDAVFTNPNKSNVFLGRDVMDAGSRLTAIATASTGRNHIDLEYARTRNVTVLSLTDERHVIDRISSTAEHALALALAAIRRIPHGFDAVRRGEWDYLPFIGRQLDHLTAGVIGYGRLGSRFARYAQPLFRKVLACDPYVQMRDAGVEQVGLDRLLRECDVISVHTHVTPETTGMLDRKALEQVKPDVVLVNTARGEMFDEEALIEFLNTHPRAMLAADVVAGEVTGKQSSPLIAYARSAANIILTPHVGGMTVEAQRIAYMHAATLLQQFFARRERSAATAPKAVV